MTQVADSRLAGQCADVSPSDARAEADPFRMLFALGVTAYRRDDAHWRLPLGVASSACFAFDRCLALAKTRGFRDSTRLKSSARYGRWTKHTEALMQRLGEVLTVGEVQQAVDGFARQGRQMRELFGDEALVRLGKETGDQVCAQYESLVRTIGGAM